MRLLQHNSLRHLLVVAMIISSIFGTQAQNDSNRVDALNQLSGDLCDQGKTDSSLTLANQALSLAKELNYRKGEARAYSAIASVYDLKGNYLKALEYHFLALKLRQQLGDKKAIAGSYNNVGLIYYSINNYPEALRYNNLSLAIKEQEGDSMGISASYNNIANIYADERKFEEALRNYTKSLEMSIDLKDDIGIAQGYLNIGILQGEMEMYDSALHNLKIALALNQKADDRLSEGSTCQSIGSVLVKLGKAREAKEWLVKGLNIGKESGAKDDIRFCYRDLAAADSALGNYEEAFYDYRQYILYRDSLVNEDITRKSVQQQMQFEFDKREGEVRIEQQKKDALALAASKRQRVIIAAVSSGLAIILVLSIVTLRSLRVNQKKNRIIEAQKQAVERQKDIIEQKQKEMLDSIRYAKRIQQALITNEHYIHKNIRRLKKI